MSAYYIIRIVIVNKYLLKNNKNLLLFDLGLIIAQMLDHEIQVGNNRSHREYGGAQWTALEDLIYRKNREKLAISEEAMGNGSKRVEKRSPFFMETAPLFSSLFEFNTPWLAAGWFIAQIQ